MSDQLKTDSNSLQTSSSNVQSAAASVADTHGTLTSHLKSCGLDAGKYAFQKVISDVLWDIINKVPLDVAKVVGSYAEGLLHLDQVVTQAEDQLLSVTPQQPGGPLQGGADSPQGSSPSLQGGSPSLQGGSPRLQG
jgi:hypothetical protein